MARPKSRPKSNNNVELFYEAQAPGNLAKARYVLSSKRKLVIELETETTLKECTIDLLAMSPDSKRLRQKTAPGHQVGRNLLLGLVFVALAIAVALLLGLPRIILAALLAAVAVMMSIYIAKYTKANRRQRRKYVFVSRAAQVPLVEIEFVKRSNKLDRFVAVLQERIKAALAASELDEKELLAGELRALRRLVESGFLEKKPYEKAKRFLLARSGG